MGIGFCMPVRILVGILRQGHLQVCNKESHYVI